VIAERVAAAVGQPVRSLRRIKSRGYAAAYHAIVELDDGSTAFVKAGAEEVTSGFLRDELRFYQAVQAPFMPRLLGFDEGDPPFLVLEDLSDCRWPPPWDDAVVASVRAALAAVAATPPPGWLDPIDRDWLLGGWAEVEGDPDPFLATGMCPAIWLDSALPVLREAAESAPVDGTTLVHLDVRSDNICLADRGAVLVDWNFACLANPDLDIAGWLPSLRLEGGPRPEELLPGAGAFAAALAGFFAARVGLPPPETAPQVRSIQKAQLEVALSWAARELGLRSVQ
jgi:hypothetical protein